MTPLYLRSRTDGSVQPYAIRLPREFARDQTYPLVVQLHGLNFMEVLSGSRVRYQGMGGPQWIESDLPVIYVNCFGRPSTFYRGHGRGRRARSDRRSEAALPRECGSRLHHGPFHGRVGFLHGRPALPGPLRRHHAHRWGDGGKGTGRELRPRRPGWSRRSRFTTPSKLYPNARNVDVFFKNAGAGIQGRSTEFTDGIVEQGGFSTAESFPRMPHNFGDQYPYAHFVTELIQHPIRRKPSEVKYYTNTLRYDRAYWVTIDRLTRHNADARVVATCDEDKGGHSGHDHEHRRAHAPPRRQPRGQGRRRSVVDGTTVIPGLSRRRACRSRSRTGRGRRGRGSGPSLTKKHGLQGPIDDAFNSRFLAVYGEGDRDLAIAELDAIRNPPSVLDIHGDFPMKAAAKVTTEDVESANLILFGTPESNAVLRRIAPSLPPALMQTGDDGARPIFIYPNPENPARYVVVWPAKLLSVPGDARYSLDHAALPASRPRAGEGRQGRLGRPLRQRLEAERELNSLL